MQITWWARAWLIDLWAGCMPEYWTRWPTWSRLEQAAACPIGRTGWWEIGPPKYGGTRCEIGSSTHPNPLALHGSQLGLIPLAECINKLYTLAYLGLQLNGLIWQVEAVLGLAHCYPYCILYGCGCEGTCSKVYVAMDSRQTDGHLIWRDFEIAGVAIGSGWQALVAYVNLSTYYIIGLPIGCVLGFKTSLGVTVSINKLLPFLIY